MKTLITIIFLVLISCNRGKIIPHNPFIVIGYEPYKFDVTETGIKYKVIDKNGYVFYFSEPLEYKSSPKYMLGDTIK